MMFNGLIMCGDSDNSDFTKESHGASSGAGSGQCSALARALHYHDKLITTMQILENKEEMIRIQADSLRLAESRIAELSARAEDLRQKLQDKTNDLALLQLSQQMTHKSSAPATTEVQDQHRVVRTLECNLSVIEELYRECFFEAAKQEKLIEMLRSDILDVRLMDKQKDTQIQKLQDVVHTQKWSLERCQDIAMEVDSLKMEISNFLNSSNNDSGMWERDSSPSQGDAIEDLREISAQLLQLRDMLTTDCTCGLEAENKRLKQANAAMKLQIAEMEQRLADKENELAEKNSVEQRLEDDVDTKEKELSDVRQQLERCSKEQSAKCEALTQQLDHAEALLSDKSAELASVQRLHAQEESVVRELKMELQQRAAGLSTENKRIRDEVQSLRAQVSMWRAQLADSERGARALRDQLARAGELCRRVDSSYHEKVQCAAELQCQLEEARERGATLCSDTRLVLDAVRRWTCAARQIRGEQEQKIKEQQETINSLQRQLDDKTNKKSSKFEPCCSKSIPRPRSQRSFDMDVVGRSSSLRIGEKGRGSATETTSGSSAPVPPLRMARKKSSHDKLCLCKSQRDRRQAARPPELDVSPHSGGGAPAPPDRLEDVRFATVFANPFRHRDLSPTSELEARVTQLDEALSRRQRRWTKTRSASHTR